MELMGVLNGAEPRLADGRLVEVFGFQPAAGLALPPEIKPHGCNPPN
jgi:hypothetical protein